MAPSASSWRLVSWAMARFTTFSNVPAGPTAPGSSPPCPASSTTWAPVDRRSADGGLTTARRPGHERPVRVLAEHRQHHAGRGHHALAAARRSARATAATGRGGRASATRGRRAGRRWSSSTGSWSTGWPRRPARAGSSPRRRSPRPRSSTSAAPSSPRNLVPTPVTMPRTRAPTGRAARAQRCLTTSTMRVPASVGFWPTCTPAAWSASCLAAAVPLPPETMAPAWPIFLPGGAVTPAM